MARATVSIGGIDALRRRMDPSGLMDQVHNALEDNLEIGERAMKDAIATRGTGKTWSREWGGRTGSFPGRVDSGDMQDDAQGEITNRTPHSVTGQLGWEDGSPLYYRLQEGGFRHVLTGEIVEGMRALADSAELVKNGLMRDLENIARSI